MNGRYTNERNIQMVIALMNGQLRILRVVFPKKVVKQLL